MMVKNKNILNSPRLTELKHHRRKAVFIKFLKWFLIIFFLVLGSIYLSRLPEFQIGEIKIAGARVLDSNNITSDIQKELSGKYFFLFPKSNIFLYSKKNLLTILTHDFKRIKNVDFKIVNKNILSVTLEEREALYTWCGKTLPEIGMNENETCYFVDSNGFVFDEAPHFSPEVFFRFYGEVSSDNYFAKDVFKQLAYFKKMIEEIGLKPAMLLLEENKNAKILLSVNNSSNRRPEIIFKTDTDLQKVAENLDAAIHADPLKTEIKNKYSSLSYIDLRFGNKVYYKFK